MPAAAESLPPGPTPLQAAPPVPSGHHRALHPHGGFFNAIKAALEVLIIAMFVVTFIVQPYRIPSGSMEPTLLVGDFLMVDKQAYGPRGAWAPLLPSDDVHRGDLVVFHFPVDPETHVVKRVVGVPGDRVRLREGQVWLNGVPLHEPYAFRSPSQPESFRDDFPSLRTADPNVDPRWWAELRRTISRGEITVPPNSYFVLGDNRNNSEDSRYWGFVPRAAIVGRPLVVYFSLSRQSTVPRTQSRAALLVSRLRHVLSEVRVLR